MLRYFIILCFVSLSFNCWSQNIIEGRVIDAETMLPLAGCNVMLKNSNSHTRTDTGGHFFIRLNSVQDTLIVSRVQYVTVKKPLTDSSNNLLLAMTQLTNILDEVVVNTGYQSIPKERAAGSFTQIDNATLNQQVGSNILKRLDGIASGVVFPKQQLQSGPTNGFMIRGLSI